MPAATLLVLVEFGVSLREVAGMSLNEIAFWVVELESYFERDLQ
jgi:hypothetical protein